MRHHQKLATFGWASCALLILNLQGCSMAPMIGAKPSDPPPRIVHLGARDAKGNEYVTWQNVSSFGPVPAELKKLGDDSCMRIEDRLRAVGYHPAATDQFGQRMAGGGFFCTPVVLNKK